MVDPVRLGSAARGAWARLRAAPLATRLLVILLVGGSVADLATTRLALEWGATERSPGGSLVLAALGLLGLVGLKVVALLVVWLLSRQRRRVGGAIGWGLAVMTALAVGSNFAELAVATALA